MNFEVKKVQAVTVIAPNGKLTIDSGADALRAKVMECLTNDGAINILLNMEEVSALDSTGIRELVNAFAIASNFGARFKLCVLPPNALSDDLDTSQLNAVFEIFDTEKEALNTF